MARNSGVGRLHAHLSRHMFAVNYLLNGGDIFTLQEILRHTTLDLADGDVFGKDIEWIEESPRKIILRYNPPCDLFPDLNEPCATPKMCLALGNFEFKAAKMIPNIKVTFAKMLTAGDPYCDIVFEQIEEK